MIVVRANAMLENSTTMPKNLNGSSHVETAARLCPHD